MKSTTKRVRFSDAQKLVLSISQNGRCGICGAPLPPRGMEVDHIIPVSLGGKNARSNVRLVCKYCNRARGNRV